MLVSGKDMKLGDVVNYQGERYTLENDFSYNNEHGDYYVFNGHDDKGDKFLDVYFEETYNVVERAE